MLRGAGERDRSVSLSECSPHAAGRKPPLRLLRPGTITDDILATLLN